MSHCHRLTDKSWVLLGSYKCSQGLIGGDDSTPSNGMDDEFEAAQAFGGWQGWQSYAAEGGEAAAGPRSSSSSSGGSEEGEEIEQGELEEQGEAPAGSQEAAGAALVGQVAALQTAGGGGRSNPAVNLQLPQVQVQQQHQVQQQAQQAPQGLRSVVVRGCRGLTDHGVRQLLGGSGSKHSLEALDVSRTVVSSSGLQLPPYVSPWFPIIIDIRYIC